MADLSRLRYMSNGSDIELYGMLETVRVSDIREPINEVYFGKAKLKGVERIMNRIEANIKADPMVDIATTPESAALDAELCKVFGFKSCHVYWMRDPGMDETGPYTIPAARVMNQKNSNLAYGSFKNGVYDKDHVMVVYIQMDNALVTEGHLTGPEMTAVLIHEIGHNFDFTPHALVAEWFRVIEYIVDFIRTLDPSILVRMGINTVTGYFDPARKFFMELDNLEDTIARLIPPFKSLFYYIDYGLNVVQKFVNMILTPPVAVVSIPLTLFCMPINWVLHYYTRKSETYADSMAAVYGYGPEQVSALDKIGKQMLTFNNAPRGMFVVFDNITLFYQEIASIAAGGHTSDQQRAKHMIDNLRREVDNPKLDRETRKACKKELARMEKTYNDIIMMNNDERMILTNMLRRTMDAWYKGTAPKYMDIFDPEHTYVQ